MTEQTFGSGAVMFAEGKLPNVSVQAFLPIPKGGEGIFLVVRARADENGAAVTEIYLSYKGELLASALFNDASPQDLSSKKAIQAEMKGKSHRLDPHIENGDFDEIIDEVLDFVRTMGDIGARMASGEATYSGPGNYAV